MTIKTTAAKGYVYQDDELFLELEGVTYWGYDAIRGDITSVEIDKSVKKYHGLTSTKLMFANLSYSESIKGAEYLDVSDVTDMTAMFVGYGEYSESADNVPNVSNWDTSKAENMCEMFNGFCKFNDVFNAVPDISNWDTSKVTDMARMFCNYALSSAALTKTPDVSDWNTSNATDISGMFSSYGSTSPDLKFELDLSGWNISNVTDASGMFNCAGLSGTWNVMIPMGEKDGDDNWQTANVVIDLPDGREFTEKQATKTLAKILATNPDIPTSESDTPPANAWLNENNSKCKAYIGVKNSEERFYLVKEDTGAYTYLKMSCEFTKVGDDYVRNGYNKYTCYMENGKVVAIQFEAGDSKYESLNGTYAPAAGIKYMAWDDANKKLVEKSTTEAIEVTNSTTTLDAGKFYIVKGADVTTGTLTVNGTATSPTTLILADGAKLTATGGVLQAGIKVSYDKALVITGQSGGTGTLIAKGNNRSAGIGGGDMTDGGTVTINGGVVTANGGKWGAGIGSGDDGTNGGTVTINGGTVTATGGDSAAAIGGGRDGGSSILTFGEGVNFTIKAGTNKDNTVSKTTTEYASDHSAKYVGIEESTEPEGLTDGYYLIGKLNGVEGWNVDSLTSDRMFEENEWAPGEYMIAWTFCDGDEIKVVKVESGVITDWYKEDEGENYAISASRGEAGECTVYFSPSGNTGWAYNYLYVEPKQAPAPV